MFPWLDDVIRRVKQALSPERPHNAELVYSGTPSSFATRVLERAQHEASELPKKEQFKIAVTLPTNLNHDEVVVAVMHRSGNYDLRLNSCFDGVFSFTKQ